jgi:hypothetical protein
MTTQTSSREILSRSFEGTRRGGRRRRRRREGGGAGEGGCWG